MIKVLHSGHGWWYVMERLRRPLYGYNVQKMRLHLEEITNLRYKMSKVIDCTIKQPKISSNVEHQQHNTSSNFDGTIETSLGFK